MSMKSVRKGAAERINQLQGKDGDKIGLITYWSCEGSIAVADLQELFTKHGLEQEWFPPSIRGSAAFRKALAVARNRVSGYILRPIVDDDDKIVWGIVRETVDKVKVDLAHATEAKVAYKKDTEEVRCKGTGQALALAEEVKAAYANLTETFIARDIQRMLKRNIGRDMGSITLRRGGGFYFTPPKFLGLIEKHKAIVDEINESDMGILVLTDAHAVNKKTVGADTRRSLEDDLNEVKAEIERYRTSSPREDTLERRLEEFKALKARCSMYSNMLGIQVKDLHQGINDCAKQLKGIIGQVQVKKAEEAEEREVKKEAAKEAAKELRRQAKALKQGAQVRRIRRVQQP